MILFADKIDAVLPDADDGGDDADRKAAALQRLALLDMGLQVADMPPALDADAWPAGKPDLTQGVAHGATAGTVTRGVDLGFGHAADIGSAAEETSKMSFLVAPRSDLDGAFDIGIGIEHARRFQRIDDAKRPVEPARIVLAFEMGAGQQSSVRILCWCRANCRCRRWWR